MCDLAADYYENFFKSPDNIYHPHPYTDAPDVEWENYLEIIPPATVEEVVDVIIIDIGKKVDPRIRGDQLNVQRNLQEPASYVGQHHSIVPLLDENLLVRNSHQILLPIEERAYIHSSV
ncbi:unnamed protein product [Adineta steineri]|uniref:Uncharacterized protein n=1 Tax=Adineta steineri TaxID=433720 RepID=A0A815KY78_9BILA|nr:unnamed protein product [Adineta steineri]CAF1401731.1 unnamed protein product [Adineta steineri]